MRARTLLGFPSSLHIVLAFDVDADKGLDDLYEVEDYEDKISAQRGMLRVLTLSLFLGYLFCAAYAYHGAKTADGRRKKCRLLYNSWILFVLTRAHIPRALIL